VIAQERCVDAEVDRIQTKTLELSATLYIEMMKRAPHDPGEYKRYDPTPTETSLEEQISAQYRLIERCAELGNAWAQYLYGTYLETRGDKLVFISKDKATLQNAPQKATQAQSSANDTYAMANKWFGLAADQGYAQAMMSLGHNHALGKGLVESRPMAIEWFNKAANRAIDTGKPQLAAICLKRMTALDPGHPLTQALAKSLDNGASGGMDGKGATPRANASVSPR